LDLIRKTKMKSKLSESLGPNPKIEKNIPEDVKWIDDAFYIKKTCFGLYTSVLKEPLGANFLTALNYDGCLNITSWHLKCLQDGTMDQYTRVVGSAIVEGKL